MDVKNMDHWAKYCDIIWADTNHDIEFYKTEALRSKGKILEIACGTGRIYLEILKQECDIYGFDISPEILKVLKKKARGLELKPKVYRADMRNFKLDHKFSLIIIPFRSFMCNITIDDQINTLKSVKKHLLPKGKLIIDVFNPNIEMLKNISQKKVFKRNIKSIKKPRYRIRNRSFFIDEANHVIGWTTSVYENNKKVWEGEASIALIPKREFELLLRSVGFCKWTLYGDFKYNPFKSTKRDMVWIIENGG